MTPIGRPSALGPSGDGPLGPGDRRSPRGRPHVMRRRRAIARARRTDAAPPSLPALRPRRLPDPSPTWPGARRRGRSRARRSRRRPPPPSTAGTKSSPASRSSRLRWTAPSTSGLASPKPGAARRTKPIRAWRRWGGCRPAPTASRCAKLAMSTHKLKERAVARRPAGGGPRRAALPARPAAGRVPPPPRESRRRGAGAPGRGLRDAVSHAGLGLTSAVKGSTCATG